MVRYREADSAGLQRLLNHARKPARTRVSGRHRSKKKGTTLSSLQKAQLQIERRDRVLALNTAVKNARDDVWRAAKKMHDDFQSHSAEYFQQLIMQTSRIKSRQRKTSRWNAFLSKEIQTRNADVADGSERTRVANGEVTREIADKWHAMSKKEQEAATDDTLKELEERHENYKTGTHTVPIQAFHDARKTLGALQREIEDLNMRTGTEILIFAVRSETSSFTQPWAFYTNDRLKEFINFTTGDTPELLAVRLEGYCVSGMKGVAFNYVQGLLNLKKEVAALITSKLKDACHSRGLVNRMCYVNFDDKITKRYGVVIEHWPLTRFCAPGDIGSRPELDTLLGAWRDGRARFRCMDDEEWEAWLAKRSADQSGSGDGASDGVSPDVDVDVDTDAQAPAPIVNAASTGTTTTTPALTASTASAIPVPVSTPATESAAPVVASRKRSRGEVSFVTVNVVTGEDGRSIAVAKRARKPRKGKEKASGDGAGPSNVPAASASAEGSGSTVDTGPRKKSAKGKGKKKASPAVVT